MQNKNYDETTEKLKRCIKRNKDRNGCILLRHLNKKLANKSEFINYKTGSIGAMRDGIKTLIKDGFIVEITPYSTDTLFKVI